jgi:hypothetical protein
MRGFVLFRNLIFVAFLVTLCLALAGVTSAAADPKDEYKREPGFVDFDRMGVFKGMEASVEVFLKSPLINFAREALKHDEPEVADILAGIKLVQVQVFSLEDLRMDDLRDKTAVIADKLDKKGWELTVRVREEDQNVYIYFLPGKDNTVEGLVVMAIEANDEAVFLNIVGNIDPTQIGKITQSLHINDLEIPDEVIDEIEKKKAKRKARSYDPDQ